ncbi:MAG: hypothetical protein ABFC96_03725 [Thermoguttaceae bacterium]
MSDAPSPNGRDGRGRFSAGNREGRGNPYARRVAKLRSTLLDAMTPAVMLRLVNALIQKAERGDTAALKLAFTYLLGEPIPLDVFQQIQDLRETLRSIQDGHSRQSA